MQKKILAFLVLVAFPLFALAQISTNVFYDGYWGQWQSHSSSLGASYDEYSLFGNYSGFIIYNNGAHPSEYIFKFQAYSYVTPDKKTIKSHYKNKLWYEYSGTVEYYVTENYPTIAAILKTFKFPCFNCNSGSAGNPCVKRTANATIKIEPYKKRPRCYNIYFDNVAIAIDLENSYFPQ